MKLLASLSLYKTSSPDVGGVCTHAVFQFSDDLYQIATPDSGERLLFAKVDSGKQRFNRHLWT